MRSVDPSRSPVSRAVPFASRMLLVAMMLLPGSARAQWAANGNALCTASGLQQNIAVAPDGLGGSVMVWEDNRVAGGARIYARQVDDFGAVQWTANGVPLCTTSGGHLNPSVAYDGAGFLLYTWDDQRGDGDIYASATDQYGNLMGNDPQDPNGFPLCTATTVQNGAVLTANQGIGVGFAAWTDQRGGTVATDIYAQAFDREGSNYWIGDGLPICVASGTQNNPSIAPDLPNDGVIIAWVDSRLGYSSIWAQHASVSGGGWTWAPNGVRVCPVVSTQTVCRVVSDDAGGAIVAWIDGRNSPSYSIYAQRLSPGGTARWVGEGVLVATTTGFMNTFEMIPDGIGGAILTWSDDRAGGPDIYAERIDSDGTRQWAPNGAAVCTATGTQSQPDLVTDGGLGALITWQDLRGTHNDVYAQQIESGGAAVWTANGILISGATNNQSNPHLAKAGTGSCIIAWEDFRSGSSYDVYAQRFDLTIGRVGHPFPTIVSIADVPGDEGGHVRIQWKPGDGPVNNWSIWRYTDSGEVMAGSGTGAGLYTTDVATTADGVHNTFAVVVWTPTNTWTSASAGGISIDNLAPAAPRLSGSQYGGDVHLSWNATASDVLNWQIQRNAVQDYATSPSAGFVDSGTGAGSFTYRVRGVDVHGNVGGWSNEATVTMVTGVEDSRSTPPVLTLLGNGPNPFRLGTRLRFGLPHEADVRLEVYNVAGRRVASRAAGILPAGWHDLAFDGRDNAGNGLPGGVYYYRLRAGGETGHRTMVISR